jgi:hypothetical protein
MANSWETKTDQAMRENEYLKNCYSVEVGEHSDIEVIIQNIFSGWGVGLFVADEMDRERWGEVGIEESREPIFLEIKEPIFL